MRSSKRAPTAIIRSQSCIAQLNSQVPCMPSMPGSLFIGRRKRAETHQRRGNGKTGELGDLAQELTRRRTGIDHATAGVEQRALGRRPSCQWPV